ncbi:hypothetical protein B0H63DRAFT_470974 [Podospora didyma]|uniref:Uncharacterized protein n=1 Tax=Podospora didyma TaxID=330526 RepID=A0AAE0U1R3_9PEZI|nr:hypothetical protein B0H63DRAFT_470974 [Podospora didyma]
MLFSPSPLSFFLLSSPPLISPHIHPHSDKKFPGIMPETGKKPKLHYEWSHIFTLWGYQLLKLMYTSSALCIPWLFLSLTPVLWAPYNWLFWLSMISADGVPNFAVLSDDALLGNTIGNLDPPGRCMSRAEKINATLSTSVDEVSGWYGPGAYLAWLVTAYVASFGSIWQSKCARSEALREKDREREGRADEFWSMLSLPRFDSGSTEEPENVLDGETLAALLYPLIALCDVLVRFIRCKIDPGINAAVFVLFSALMIFGPTSRLSWQVDGVDNDLDFLPKTNRSWAWKFSGFMIHGVIITIIGEPYSYALELLIPVYVMLFALMLYSLFAGEFLSESYPYRGAVYRPRAERCLMFGLLQVVFFSVAYGKIGTVWPVTGSSLSELDQAGTLCVTVLTLLYLKLDGIRSLVSGIKHRLSGFRQVRESENNGGMELQEVVVHGTE